MNIPDKKDELLAQIEELVERNTFTATALAGIVSIKERLAEVLGEKVVLEARLEKLKGDYNQLVAERSKLQHDVTEAIKKVEALEAERDKARQAIHEADKQTAVAAAWREAMLTVFRPSATRETIQRAVAKPVEGTPPRDGHYGTPGFLATGNESETIMREDA